MTEKTSRESDLEDLIAAFMFLNGIDEIRAEEMEDCECMACKLMLAMYRQVEGRMAMLAGESVH